MQSVREILDRGDMREVVRLACELAEVKERLEELLKQGFCPRCGAQVFRPEVLRGKRK